MVWQTLSHIFDVSSIFRHGGLACPSVLLTSFSSLLRRPHRVSKFSRPLLSSSLLFNGEYVGADLNISSSYFNESLLELADAQMSVYDFLTMDTLESALNIATTRNNAHLEDPEAQKVRDITDANRGRRHLFVSLLVEQSRCGWLPPQNKKAMPPTGMEDPQWQKSGHLKNSSRSCVIVDPVPGCLFLVQACIIQGAQAHAIPWPMISTAHTTCPVNVVAHDVQQEGK